jgi:hypothetical protein
MHQYDELLTRTAINTSTTATVWHVSGTINRCNIESQNCFSVSYGIQLTYERTKKKNNKDLSKK